MAIFVAIFVVRGASSSFVARRGRAAGRSLQRPPRLVFVPASLAYQEIQSLLSKLVGQRVAGAHISLRTAERRCVYIGLACAPSNRTVQLFIALDSHVLTPAFPLPFLFPFALFDDLPPPCCPSKR